MKKNKFFCNVACCKNEPCSKSKYIAPDSKIILMETEGFIATSGEVPDYGDGGELSYLNTPGGDKFLKKA